MEFVSKWEDIEKNMLMLEEYRNSKNKDYVEFYTNLIKRGICFVVYEHNGEFLFGPSRFIGYVNNSLEAHSSNTEKHGTRTNSAISKILGCYPDEDEVLQQKYEALCDSLGVKQRKTGSYGKIRKYWLKQ